MLVTHFTIVHLYHLDPTWNPRTSPRQGSAGAKRTLESASEADDESLLDEPQPAKKKYKCSLCSTKEQPVFLGGHKCPKKNTSNQTK